MWLRKSRVAGSVSGSVCTAIGLAVCAFLLPQTTIDWQGLLIAIAVIDLPLIGIDRYMRAVGGKHGHVRHLGRWGIGFAFMTLWLLGGPAVADWVTPHFNIAGVWQYVVLWLVIFGLGHAYWKIVEATTRGPDTDHQQDQHLTAVGDGE